MVEGCSECVSEKQGTLLVVVADRYLKQNKPLHAHSALKSLTPWTFLRTLQLAHAPSLTYAET